MSYDRITWEQAHRDACERADMAVGRAARAVKERDAQYRWTVEIAMLLGVQTDVTTGTTTADQYGELRARITAELRTINDLMDLASKVIKRKRANQP